MNTLDTTLQQRGPDDAEDQRQLRNPTSAGPLG
jgi:hypothetical protein